LGEKGSQEDEERKYAEGGWVDQGYRREGGNDGEQQWIEKP
jgi:hypothetical protein